MLTTTTATEGHIEGLENIILEFYLYKLQII